MRIRLELIPLPVSDVDRALAFYADRLGFHLDFDVRPREGVRVVQLTPEGRGARWASEPGWTCTRASPAASGACTWWWRTSSRRARS